MTARGLFITFEGGEGSGKTTQIRLLAQRLQQANLPCHSSREPGGTPLAERIRDILVTGAPDTLEISTELLLMVAARSDHAAFIRRQLADGVTVLCDRFTDSTLAYQGYGRGLPLEWIAQLNQFATGGLVPDLTFLLDVEAGLGLSRSQGHHKGEDRFEQEGLAFHQRLRQGFLQLARSAPERFRILDATLPVEVLSHQIGQEVAHVRQRL